MQEQTETTIKCLEDIDDEDIDYSDIPKLTKEKLLHGKIRFPNLPPKEGAEAVARLRQFAQKYDWGAVSTLARRWVTHPLHRV